MGILNEKTNSNNDATKGANSLYVRGTCYTNTAAKFWPALFDETAKDFPTCTTIELIAPTEETLKRKHLYPAALLGSLENMFNANKDGAMSEIIAELKILGPPSPVRLKLIAEEEELVSRQLPLDCIDAELLSYLVAWLLEWSGVPDPIWNNDSLDGSMIVEDKKREILYNVPFILTHRHMHEGLYERSISLVPSICKQEHQKA